jgi:hypothetical protein
MRPLSLSIAGLLLAPAIVAAASWAAPAIHVSPAIIDLIAFAGATATSLISLALLSRGALPRRARIALGSIGPCLVGVAALSPLTGLSGVVLVCAGLVWFAYALGDLIGFNIEHPGHLLPACVVASIADVTSVLHPNGPSHAVIQSEQAMSALAVSFPVMGTHEFAPTIGIGDLLFIALLLAAARKHSLSTLRMSLLVAAGIAAAGVGSFLWMRAIPALPTIGLAVVLGFAQARNVRSRDRRVAWMFVLGAALLAGVLIASRYLPTSAPGP